MQGYGVRRGGGADGRRWGGREVRVERGGGREVGKERGGGREVGGAERLGCMEVRCREVGTESGFESYLHRPPDFWWKASVRTTGPRALGFVARTELGSPMQH